MLGHVLNSCQDTENSSSKTSISRHFLHQSSISDLIERVVKKAIGCVNLCYGFGDGGLGEVIAADCNAPYLLPLDPHGRLQQ